MREYTGPTGTVYSVAFVPGAPPRLAAGTNDAAFVWEFGRAEPAAVLSYGETALESPVLLASPNGRWVVAGPGEGLRRWDLSRDPPVCENVPAPYFLAARFVGPGDRLAVAQRAEDRGVIRISTGPRSRAAKPVVTELAPPVIPAGLEPRVRTMSTGSLARWNPVALSADGRRLALSPGLKSVTAWDLRAGRMLGTVSLHGHPRAFSFSPDGAQLAIDGGTTVYIHAGATLAPVGSWKVKFAYSPGLAWSPDGRLLARTDRSTTARVYEATAGREVASLRAKRGILTCVAFAPDGLTFATGTIDGRVRVWDVG
jgi:WD40 repeat protein